MNSLIASTLVFIRRNGETLMLLRDKKNADLHKYRFNGVGGKFEKGESPEECAVREIKEETGLDAKSLLYRGFLSFPLFDDETDWLVFVYECRDFDGEIKESDEGSLYWIMDEDVPHLNVYEGDRIFLEPLYYSDDLFYGTFYYEGGEYVSSKFTRIPIKA